MLRQRSSLYLEMCLYVLFCNIQTDTLAHTQNAHLVLLQPLLPRQGSRIPGHFRWAQHPEMSASLGVQGGGHRVQTALAPGHPSAWVFLANPVLWSPICVSYTLCLKIGASRWWCSCLCQRSLCTGVHRGAHSFLRCHLNHSQPKERSSPLLACCPRTRVPFRAAESPLKESYSSELDFYKVRFQLKLYCQQN